MAIAVFDVIGDEVGEEEGVDALALILGLDGDEQEVDGIGFAQEHRQQVHPSEGEDASAALLQRL